MPKTMISDDEIREAAYHLWLDAGAPEGREEEFWFQAEARLRPAKRPRKNATPKAAAKPKAAPKAKAAPKPKPAALA